LNLSSFLYPRWKPFSISFLPGRTLPEEPSELEDGLTCFGEEAEEAWQKALSREEIWPESRRPFPEEGRVPGMEPLLSAGCSRLEVGEEGERLRLET
jgi:hypothetical protein